MSLSASTLITSESAAVAATYHEESQIMSTQAPVTGRAAGVPFIAFAPDSGDHATSPIVLAWHLLDAPRTEAAFAAALPLGGLDAWRIYLGLPMCGSRMPDGGPEEFMRLVAEDAVLNLYQPIIAGAAAEAPASLAALRERFGLRSTRIGLMGGSAGAAVVLSILAGGQIDPATAVLVSPLVRVRSAVEAGERLYGLEYEWSEASSAAADNLDFVLRAGEIAARDPQVPVRLVVGGADDEGFRASADDLQQVLAGRYAHPTRVDLVTIDGMPHALADEPGIVPAPQNTNAAAVDRLAVDWFQRYLMAG